MEKLLRSEIVRCQPASLQKLFHTSSLMYFTFIFSKRITITFSKEALKVCGYTFFQEIQVKISVTCKIVIYLFNYDSSKSTFFMLNMAFDINSFCQVNKLEFFVSCNTKNIFLFAQPASFNMSLFIKT